LLGNSTQADGSDVMDGIHWAAQQGAAVINLSIGGPKYSQTEENFYRSIRNQSILIFAAAGNDGTNATSYPGGYDSCISVGSVDKALERSGTWLIVRKQKVFSHSFAWQFPQSRPLIYLYALFLRVAFSQYGKVDLAAPGSGVLSTVVRGTGSVSVEITVIGRATPYSVFLLPRSVPPPSDMNGTVIECPDYGQSVWPGGGGHVCLIER
jgi:subtilisin family serine protease